MLNYTTSATNYGIDNKLYPSKLGEIMDINEVILVLQTLVLTIQTVLTVKILKIEWKTKSTYECDSLHMEIKKTLLSDPRLFEFYNIGNDIEKEFWSGLTEDQKRMFIFCEMNYFHFAFVYREYREGRVPESYWKLYENWLRELLKYSPMFIKVHESSRGHYGQKQEFAIYVDKLRREGG